MKKILALYITAFLIALSPLSRAEINKTIHIVSQGWENYADADCKGYMWELVQSVFETHGYKIKCTIMPYKRGVEMVKQNRADAWIASYKDEQKFALYPQWPHDFESTGVAATKELMKSWTPDQGLSGKRVAYVRGYELDNYIDDDFKRIEVNNLKQAMDMVIAGRSDFVADDSDDMKSFLQSNPRYQDALEVRPLFRLALYLAFADGVRSRELIKIWDTEFPKLLDKGVIKSIYSRANKGKNYKLFWENDANEK